MFPHISLSQCYRFEMSNYAVSGVIRITLATGRDKKYHAENKFLFSVASLPGAAVPWTDLSRGSLDVQKIHPLSILGTP